MNTDYRWIARQALQRAQSELKTGNPDRLPYAALELRYSMEALTYDRAQCYKGEVPAGSYQKWQPRKVVEYITGIDPDAYISSSLALGVEDEPGTAAKVMKPLGADNALTMKDLKDHYDAMGSLLHIPTLHQIQQNKVADRERLKERCERCAGILERVLASPIWNVRFGVFAELECMRCQFPIKKRLKPGATDPIDVRCINCGAEYAVTDEGEGRIGWRVKMHGIECPTIGCTEKTGLWEDELRPGIWWKCQGCGKRYGIELSVRERPADEQRQENTETSTSISG